MLYVLPDAAHIDYKKLKCSISPTSAEFTCLQKPNNESDGDTFSELNVCMDGLTWTYFMPKGSNLEHDQGCSGFSKLKAVFLED